MVYTCVCEFLDLQGVADPRGTQHGLILLVPSSECYWWTSTHCMLGPMFPYVMSERHLCVHQGAFQPPVVLSVYTCQQSYGHHNYVLDTVLQVV